LRAGGESASGQPDLAATTVLLRHLLRKKLAGWKNDLPAAWRKILGETELNFESRALLCQCRTDEIVIPGRKGELIPGAPARAHLFRAFDQLKPESVRAVILGQDPYPNPAWATGRAFEQGNLTGWPVNRREIADSLRRIIQVLANARTGNTKYINGDQGWKMLVQDLHKGRLFLESPRRLFDHLQDEGVLLLNTSLTLSVDASSRPKRIRGHFRLWEPLIYCVLEFLASRERVPTVFLLWGRHAWEVVKRGGICDTAERAHTLQSTFDIVRHAHPAAITREGAVFLRPPNPLMSANKVLERMGDMPIAW
jgi:uracil-DNA glycosylase